MKYKFKIKGLDCANCAAELERKKKKIDGIEDASISFMSERLVIQCEESIKSDVIEILKKVAKKEEPDVTIEEI